MAETISTLINKLAYFCKECFNDPSHKNSFANLVSDKVRLCVAFNMFLLPRSSTALGVSLSHVIMFAFMIHASTIEISFVSIALK